MVNSTQPRPQGLFLDDFQNGGSSGEDPEKGCQNLQKSWRFLAELFSGDF